MQEGISPVLYNQAKIEHSATLSWEKEIDVVPRQMYYFLHSRRLAEQHEYVGFGMRIRGRRIANGSEEEIKARAESIATFAQFKPFVTELSAAINDIHNPRGDEEEGILVSGVRYKQLDISGGGDVLIYQLVFSDESSYVVKFPERTSTESEKAMLRQELAYYIEALIRVSDLNFVPRLVAHSLRDDVLVMTCLHHESYMNRRSQIGAQKQIISATEILTQRSIAPDVYNNFDNFGFDPDGNLTVVDFEYDVHAKEKLISNLGYAAKYFEWRVFESALRELGKDDVFIQALKEKRFSY